MEARRSLSFSLEKGVYPYSYVDQASKFNEGSFYPYNNIYLLNYKLYIGTSKLFSFLLSLIHTRLANRDNCYQVFLPKMPFKNELTGDDLTDEDYQHVQTVWDRFEMDTLGDLHDL